MWIKCPREGCRGTVTNGDCVCSNCGCLILHADQAGMPYCPAHTALKGALTGLRINYTEVKKEAAAEAEKAIASSKSIVATLANLHCQGRVQDQITQALAYLRVIQKDSTKFCISCAENGDRDEFREKFTSNSRHPLSVGRYCKGESYEAYLDIQYPPDSDMSFYNTAMRARALKKTFCPFPPPDRIDIRKSAGDTH